MRLFHLGWRRLRRSRSGCGESVYYAGDAGAHHLVQPRHRQVAHISRHIIEARTESRYTDPIRPGNRFGAHHLFIISGHPWLTWANDNAPLLQADIRRTRLGIFIARNTLPQATIAVHAAGQIPYYSERRTIDLLGLNDPVVAKGPVTGPFYPGHDKWNYEYSIAQLKPDLIADNWIKLADFMQDQNDYRHLDNGIYIRKDSTLLNVVGLSKEYR